MNKRVIGELRKYTSTPNYVLNFIDSITVDMSISEIPLSFKNCKAVELGYDLDELSEEDCKDLTNEDYKYISINGYKVGFEKALDFCNQNYEDILNFTKNCAENWDCDSYGHKYGTGCRACEAKTLMEKMHKSKWLVEVIMEDMPNDVDPDKWIETPKLDSDGCLTLRRID